LSCSISAKVPSSISSSKYLRNDASSLMLKFTFAVNGAVTIKDELLELVTNPFLVFNLITSVVFNQNIFVLIIQVVHTQKCFNFIAFTRKRADRQVSVL